MHRLLVILLILLLPAQSTFAAASLYCAAEKVETPAHFGHHQHADEPPVANPAEDEPAALEVHCAVCHLACSMMQAPERAIASVSPVAFGPPPAGAPSAEHLQEPTERPPRPALA